MLLEIDRKQDPKSRRRFRNGFWIFNRLPNGLRYRRLGRKRFGNGKLPKLRTTFKKRADSQPSGARCVRRAPARRNCYLNKISKNAADRRRILFISFIHITLNGSVDSQSIFTEIQPMNFPFETMGNAKIALKYWMACKASS